jgi:murein L,D-transpeptidase YafK
VLIKFNSICVFISRVGSYGLLCLALCLFMCQCGTREASEGIARSTPEVLDPRKLSHWILVDSRTDSLHVMKGAEKVISFSNIAFGSSGVGTKLKKGDRITPQGEFLIGWIRPGSKFHRFFGLVYPRLSDAKVGLEDGRISAAVYESIKRALEMGRVPPQDTALGGYIGIHGIGRGDVTIHRDINWTDGCIALENDQIDKLSNWLRVGMMVEIQ